MPKEYDELRIRIWEVGTGRYFVLANGLASASTLIDVRDPAAFHEELEELVEQEFRGDARPEDGYVQRRLKELAKRLTDCFFPKTMENCFHASLSLASKSQRGLRLRFEMPAVLQDIPVEILRSTANYLAPLQDVSIVRSWGSNGSVSIVHHEPADKLTIILAGAVPTGDPIESDVDAVIEGIENDLASEIEEGRVVILPALAPGGGRERATRERLRGWLAQAKGTCVLVVMAHGYYDHVAGEGGVVLVDESGGPDEMNEEDLAGLRRTTHDLRFVSLNLCRGGQGDLLSRDPFSGIACLRIGAGIPIVMASQFAASKAIDLFCRTLLIQACQGCWIDESSAAARVMFGPRSVGPVEWCLPALHLHEQCYTTQLLRSPRTSAEEKKPEEKPLEVAQSLVRRARVTKSWERALHIATGELRKYPGDSVLLALLREAQVEANIVGQCRNACLALSEGRPAEALEVLNGVAVEERLVEPLRQLASGRGPKAPDSKTPGPEHGWEAAKKRATRTFIGRE